MKTQALFIAFLVSFIGIAQPLDHHERMEKNESARIAFITTELNLSTEMAQQFWPVYNEMREKVKVIMKTRHENLKKMRDNSALSATDKERIILETFKSEAAMAQLKVEYHNKFKAVLGLEKSVQLFEAEMAFQRKMMERFKRRGERQGNARRDR